MTQPAVPDADSFAALLIRCVDAPFPSVTDRSELFRRAGLEEWEPVSGSDHGVVAADPVAFGRWFGVDEQVVALGLIASGAPGGAGGHAAQIVVSEALADRYGAPVDGRWVVGSKAIAVDVPEDDGDLVRGRVALEEWLDAFDNGEFYGRYDGKG